MSLHKRFVSKTAAGGAIGALAIVAFGLLAGSAARAATQAERNACTFVLHLSPAHCTRLLRMRHHSAGHAWLSPAAKSGNGLVYASQPFEDVVDVATVDGQGLTPAGQLALGKNSTPIGLAVDAKRRLYVTISALLGSPAIPSVEVFLPGATQPSKVYQKGLVGPVDVAVDAHGTLYVADLKQIGGGGCDATSGDAQVVEYAKGSLNPTAVINDFPGCVAGVAVDSGADLYLTYFYYPSSGLLQSDVVEYAPGSTKGTPLNLSAPGGLQLYGLTVDSKGTIVVANVQDDATLLQILTYAAGSTTPTSTIEYGGLDSWSPEYFAVRGTKLFAPAYLAQNMLSVVAEFAYPTGKQRFVQNPKLVAPGFFYGFAAIP